MGKHKKDITTYTPRIAYKHPDLSYIERIYCARKCFQVARPRGGCLPKQRPLAPQVQRSPTMTLEDITLIATCQGERSLHFHPDTKA